MSVATTVTVLMPTSNVLPEAGVATTLATAQLSVAVNVGYVTTALHNPGSLVCTRFASGRMTGGSVSFTVTVKLFVAVFPWMSVATTVTVLMPTSNVLPEAGVATTLATAQLSVAVNVGYVTTALHNPRSLVCTRFTSGRVH